MKRTLMGLTTLLIMTSPAPGLAQVAAAPGSADPLGLAAIGLVIPFFASPGNDSVLEIESPVGANLDLKVVFFTANGQQAGPSVGLPMTINDIAFLDLATVVNFDGLAVVGGTPPSGFGLIPLDNPIHARVLWANAASNFVRTLDPITVENAGGASSQTWNPLRTAATFIAPVQTKDVSTTLYLICPSSAVTAKIQGAPPLVPPGAQSLRFLVYDANEAFVRNFFVNCTSLTTLPLAALTSVGGPYSDPSFGGVFYTKISGETSGSFTGYVATQRNVRVRGPRRPPSDDFARLQNDSWQNIIQHPAQIDTQDR